MLLIMGLGNQMIGWFEGFCAQLAARGYWVIRFDNRDIGLSTKFDEAGAPDIPGLLAARERGEARCIISESLGDARKRKSPLTDRLNCWFSVRQMTNIFNEFLSET
jgi:pimeloyl-ACP methyl ester carboxylesterase